MNVSPIGLAFLTEKPRLLSRTMTMTIITMTRTAAPIPPPMAPHGMEDEAGDKETKIRGSLQRITTVDVLLDGISTFAEL